MKNIIENSEWSTEVVYLARYTGSGVVNTLIGFLIIFSAMALGISPLISNFLGYFVGFFLGFIFSRKFVFRSDGHLGKEGARYCFTFLVSFFVNIMALNSAITYFHINAVSSQLIAAGSYSLTMYLLSRCFVFLQSPHKGK